MSVTTSIIIGYIVGSIVTAFLTYKYAFERGAGGLFEFLLDHNFVRYKVVDGERVILKLDHKEGDEISY